MTDRLADAHVADGPPYPVRHGQRRVMAQDCTCGHTARGASASEARTALAVHQLHRSARTSHANVPRNMHGGSQT